ALCRCRPRVRILLPDVIDTDFLTQTRRFNDVRVLITTFNIFFGNLERQLVVPSRVDADSVEPTSMVPKGAPVLHNFPGHLLRPIEESDGIADAEPGWSLLSDAHLRVLTS